MKKRLIFIALLITATMTACTSGATDAASDNTVITSESVNEIENNDNGSEESEASVSDDATDTSDKVAEAAPEAAVEIDYDSLVPVYADSIKTGEYDVEVDCSSSMFVIDSCKVIKEDDKLIAELTMGGKGYLYCYLGTGEEAAAAPDTDYINYIENADGAHVYTFEIEGFDIPVNLAAFSKKKELWYDRVLVFKASSLSLDAFADGMVSTVSSLGLEDGEYTCEVTLEGGSGRASVESPASFVVKDGKAMVTVIWSSSSYDYMKVDDVQYDPVNEEGNSTFVIPMECFDHPCAVKADTTAMSTPHEIDYTLTFDSESIAQ